MKGIILAAGSGTRLRPVTNVVAKPLLLVYDKPMIFYPIETLLKSGIKDILFIVSPQSAASFITLLGSGKDFGAKFSYAIQDEPKGIPEAFTIGEDFINGHDVALLLGDNIFENDFKEAVKNFKSGGNIFAKEVHDPERFGVVKFDHNNKAVIIKEKPKEFISNYAITGMYIFDSRVVDIAKGLKPSTRGEMEITDIQKWYMEHKELKVDIINGNWIDAGTFDSILAAANWVFQRPKGF